MGRGDWTVPEASGQFCARGGRFGTHSSNENFTPIYYKRVLFLAHSTPVFARSTFAIVPSARISPITFRADREY